MRIVVITILILPCTYCETLDPISGCSRPLPPELSRRVCKPGWQCLVPVKPDELLAEEKRGLPPKGINYYYSKSLKVRMPENLKGVGRRVNAFVWAMFVVVPLVVSLSMILVTAIMPLDKFVPIQTMVVVFLLLAATVCSYESGVLFNAISFHPDLRKYQCKLNDAHTFAELDDRNVRAILSLLLSFLLATMSFRSAHIEFEWPRVGLQSPFMIGVLVLIVLIALGSKEVLMGAVGKIAPDRGYMLKFFIALGIKHGQFAFLPPGFSLVGLTVFYKYRELLGLYCWLDASGECSAPWATIYPIGVLSNVYCFLCYFAAYSRDRKFVSLAGFAVTFAWRFGKVNSHGIISPHFWYVVLLTFVYLCGLFARYCRVLPPELQKVKYVRIGYLRHMGRQGMKIKRCQDMPDEAFGDVTKAKELIIISHRWLHRYTCDVASSEYPNGLRLTTMLEKIERHFPTTWNSFASNLDIPTAIGLLLSSVSHGENDLLLFFDFMGVPQIGLTADGSQIDRTPLEQQLFDEALPAMGGLYTMYNVMACPDVPEGVPSYESSGWCFCEWESALLYRNLQMYSADMLASKEPDASKPQKRNTFDGIFSDSVATKFMNEFDESLKTKIFFFDKDRDTVRGIIKSRITCRTLIDAVQDQHVEMVGKLLKELSDEGLLRAISEPIDNTTLDSLLHVAVRLPSKEVVNVLIEYGAKEDVRNLAGDTPYQLFMIPRFWRNHT